MSDAFCMSVRRCSASVQCVSAVHQGRNIGWDFLCPMELIAQVSSFFLTQRDTSIFLSVLFMGLNGFLNRLSFHT